MGIQGLLSALRGAAQPASVDRFKGQRVGVDAYCWIHKAAHQCAYELAVGVPTAKYLAQVVGWARMLRVNGVTPVIVFDGRDPPLKAGTNEGRRQRRAECAERAREHLSKGEHARARDHYARSVDVSSELAYSVFQALEADGFECMVAPFEADAQLAYLCCSGYVHCVITEDSDLVAYGVPRVLFKMDHKGCGDLIERDRVLQQDWLEALPPNLFLDLCILAGCDYLPSLQGMGVKRAAKLLAQHRSTEAVLGAVAADPQWKQEADCVAEYAGRVERARAAFRFHVVWDPVALTARYMSDGDAPPDLDTIVGPLPAPSEAAAVTAGRADPRTLRPYTGSFTRHLELYLSRKSAAAAGADAAGSTQRQATLLDQWKRPAPPRPRGEEVLRRVAVGCRVRRNSQFWKWADQDGGDGREGTVSAVRGGYAWVKWDADWSASGARPARRYRCGAEGADDLLVTGAGQERGAQKQQLQQTALPVVPVRAGGPQPAAGEEPATPLSTAAPLRPRCIIRSRFWFRPPGAAAAAAAPAFELVVGAGAEEEEEGPASPPPKRPRRALGDITNRTQQGAKEAVKEGAAAAIVRRTRRELTPDDPDAMRGRATALAMANPKDSSCIPLSQLGEGSDCSSSSEGDSDWEEEAEEEQEECEEGDEGLSDAEGDCHMADMDEKAEVEEMAEVAEVPEPTPVSARAAGSLPAPCAALAADRIAGCPASEPRDEPPPPADSSLRGDLAPAAGTELGEVAAPSPEAAGGGRRPESGAEDAAAPPRRPPANPFASFAAGAGRAKPANPFATFARAR
eukprot:TRINITY_DN7317_c0_g2_i1.p1 TRINITY_DN7317_c0_g2~~TRINITY_DN7317_c0_g2_i1.p1  ORF type:complete len:798 (+),score=266.06 TRINITY_DN7317_c0_g2_i1:81-2474(+)